MMHPDLLRSIADDNARAMRKAAREARHGRRRPRMSARRRWSARSPMSGR